MKMLINGVFCDYEIQLFKNLQCYDYIELLKEPSCALTVDTLLNDLMIKNIFLSPIHFTFTLNGKLLNNEKILCNGNVIKIIPKLIGGKGGFGSMLRAIGAQIEKTTNREACRDLSGRRLRDINEEKRFKKWLAKQTDREKEIKERKQKKLEKLKQNPKHEFSDPNFNKIRSELSENVFEAVNQGANLQLLNTEKCELPSKRKHEEEHSSSKKMNLWLGIDDTELSDSSDSEPSPSNMNPNEKVEIKHEINYSEISDVSLRVEVN